ncbi:hypothetical protein SAMN05421781_0525 [Marinococcus luteus]|uniref:Uncharacterized protein n=1 Tax=Marinococcus luteus TaxID=1122204 RepID=A0A1H2QZ49_9BACI|nr:hypothetical protein [Marinococcus luteus]SDW12391.1 hypothetical protein SAMN05421781_0525 [Marinococcus luteus]
MKRRLKLTAIYGGTFFVISIMMGYIFDGELDETFVAGQTIAGITIGLFIAPHFQQHSGEKTQRLVRINRIITNMIYIFLVIFVIMFSLSFISGSIDWRAVSFFALPLIIAIVIKLIYRWRVKNVLGRGNCRMHALK